jgi:hypothetical protein
MGSTGHGGAMSAPVDLTTVLSTIDEPWSPRTVAVLNDYDDVRVGDTLSELTAERRVV